MDVLINYYTIYSVGVSCCQLHAQAVLLSRKEFVVEYETGSAPESVWGASEKEENMSYPCR